MRRFFYGWLLLLTGAVLLNSCGSSRRLPYEGRIWSGFLYRSSDSARLSPVCLRLSNDTLNIYSNALFGRSLEMMPCRRTSDSAYVAFLPNAGVEFPMEFRYTAPDSLTREALCIDGTDYWMELWPTTDSVFTAERLSFYRAREVPRDPALYVDGIWCGALFRLRDGAMLSPVCLQFTPDTLFAYSNALFGQGNHLLTYRGYSDGKFYYTGSQGEMALEPRWDNGTLNLQNDYLQMRLQPYTGSIRKALSFYREREVPSNIEAYLIGTYAGLTYGSVPQMNTVSELLGGPSDLFTLRMVLVLTFLEGGRVGIQTDGEFLCSDEEFYRIFECEKPETYDSEVQSYDFDGRYLTIGTHRLEFVSPGVLRFRGGEVLGYEMQPTDLELDPGSNQSYPEE